MKSPNPIPISNKIQIGAAVTTECGKEDFRSNFVSACSNLAPLFALIPAKALSAVENVKRETLAGGSLLNTEVVLGVQVHAELHKTSTKCVKFLSRFTRQEPVK